MVRSLRPWLVRPFSGERRYGSFSRSSRRRLMLQRGNRRLGSRKLRFAYPPEAPPPSLPRIKFRYCCWLISETDTLG